MLIRTTILALITAAPAFAACPPPAEMAEHARAWAAGGTIPDLELASPEEARCAYDGWRAALEAEFGEPVGWKVGFTSKPAQERFGVPGPVAGALFAPMILEDGASVSLTGTRTPFYEADLIVTVADPDALAAATTREAAAAALEEVRPFIELPDLAFVEGVAPTGALMTAYGVTPWRGVMGAGVKIADLADPVADLAALTVKLDSNGAEVAQGTGEMLLGHPLDVVLWLVEDGAALKAGDLISLGSLSPLTPAAPGVELEADYEVGGQTMKVTATLVE
ncbi:hydratase [Paracoccus sp. S-4012]|uniref:2-keto-4-pentenoate hydratase n=1 Tax=Paracoccus sp. S-4012 TaxID=2665648 RepID=UPI0012B0CF76|nr:hydratase [Paracoccus sp. S-4012]MRX49151.1 hydratase [Paracoccus sp. S-4012]